jgi:hypothetical protein
MTMLCRIGAGMREAMPSGVFVQFLMIGAMCPRFGALLEAWLFVEERLAGGSVLDEVALADGDVPSGWMSQDGPVWRWRQVTRFGSVLVIPVVWFVGRCDVVRLRGGLVRVAAWSPVLVAVLAAVWRQCLRRGNAGFCVFRLG